MTLPKSLRDLFKVSLLTIAMSFGTVSSAHAISFTLNWTGTNGISLTGTFTGTDNPDPVTGLGDGVIRGGNLNGSNELSDFTITFRDSTNGNLATYDLNTQLISNSSFNFNYQLSPPPAGILQAGNATDPNGFSIGISNGYILDTTSGVVNFTDNNFVYFDSGNAALTATPVPFEFEGSAGILTLGAIWGANQWRKNRLKK
jgi:hypothetical protein